MSIQRFSVAACLVLLCSGVFAQKSRVDQSFGLDGSYTKVRMNRITAETNSQMEMRLWQFGITYYPRIDIVRWDAASLSVGAPLSLGVAFTRNYHSTDKGVQTFDIKTYDWLKGTSIAFDIPVAVDLNLGLHSAADETRRHFGVYIGAGYGYSYAKLRTSLGRIPFDGYDPIIRAGLRFGKSWDRRWTLGASYRGRLDNSIHTYTLQILKDI